MNINDLNISQKIKDALTEMGYEEYTEIQEKAIPLCLEGKDVIGQSQTGTGKTAAFAIPVLEKIDPDNKKTQAIILCPTRELAVQVTNEFRKISNYIKGVKAVAIYGGEPITRQIAAIKKGAQVIIGTPGRTIDHIKKRRTVKTDFVNTVILDEADEMLKMGFREDIETILDSIENERQTILFSATMPKPIREIAEKYQKSPELIKIKAKGITAESIKQEYCEMKAGHKTETIDRLLSYYKPTRCIIFCNMKSTVDAVNNELHYRNIGSEKIHGDLAQDQRLKVLKRFNDAAINVLVATDVAARGLDIKEVDLIINYDVPEKAEYYVHRIGRSGRAGNEGHSITLVTKNEKSRFMNIMSYTKKKVEKVKIPTIKQINKAKINAFIKEITEIIDDEDIDEYKNILNQFDTTLTIEDICAALIKNNLDLEEITHEDDINFNSPNNQTKNSSSNSNKNMVRLFFNVGKKDRVKPSHILGAITGECGISGNNVGQIDILDKFSFANVDKNSADKVLKKLNGKKINGKKVAVEKAKSSK